VLGYRCGRLSVYDTRAGREMTFGRLPHMVDHIYALKNTQVCGQSVSGHVRLFDIRKSSNGRKLTHVPSKHRSTISRGRFVMHPCEEYVCLAHDYVQVHEHAIKQPSACQHTLCIGEVLSVNMQSPGSLIRSIGAHWGVCALSEVWKSRHGAHQKLYLLKRKL
jgi:hypothetical protein